MSEQPSTREARAQGVRGPGGGRLVLITGAVRSGKSRFGEELAAQLAEREDGVAYVATARVWDEEMTARVRTHRETRPDGWRTMEEPERLVEAVSTAREDGAAVVLVESLDMWVSNRLMALHPVEGENQTALDGARVRELEETLLAEMRRVVSEHWASEGCHVVVVTVEAGWGVVPAYPLGRAFRDLLGRVNSALAAEADEVYLMVAGIPVDVKRLAASE